MRQSELEADVGCRRQLRLGYLSALEALRHISNSSVELGILSQDPPAFLGNGIIVSHIRIVLASDRTASRNAARECEVLRVR